MASVAEDYYLSVLVFMWSEREMEKTYIVGSECSWFEGGGGDETATCQCKGKECETVHLEQFYGNECDGKCLPWSSN